MEVLCLAVWAGRAIVGQGVKQRPHANGAIVAARDGVGAIVVTATALTNRSCPTSGFPTGQQSQRSCTVSRDVKSPRHDDTPERLDMATPFDDAVSPVQNTQLRILSNVVAHPHRTIVPSGDERKAA